MNVRYNIELKTWAVYLRLFSTIMSCVILVSSLGLFKCLFPDVVNNNSITTPVVELLRRKKHRVHVGHGDRTEHLVGIQQM